MKVEALTMGVESFPVTQVIWGEGKPSAEQDRVTLSPATATKRSVRFVTISGNTEGKEFKKNQLCYYNGIALFRVNHRLILIGLIQKIAYLNIFQFKEMVWQFLFQSTSDTIFLLIFLEALGILTYTHTYVQEAVTHIQ